MCDRRSKLITGIYIDLPTSRTQIFSRARRANGRFLMFPAAKACERTRARLVSPAKNGIKWRHFVANYLCRLAYIVARLATSRPLGACAVTGYCSFNKAGNGLGPTTGTGHEKRSTFRKSSIYIETCILQTPSPVTKQTRMDNFLNSILYVTRPLFFCNFLNEPTLA